MNGQLFEDDRSFRIFRQWMVIYVYVPGRNITIQCCCSFRFIQLLMQTQEEAAQQLQRRPSSDGLSFCSFILLRLFVCPESCCGEI